MATGDSNDMLQRLKSSVLPRSWFAFIAPYRDALLGGLSDGLAWIYAFIATAKAETRLATATGYFLDIASYDFLGLTTPRKSGEADRPFSVRFRKEILRERVTRAGMIQALTDLTGIAPTIFEPWNPNDAGGYGAPNIGYGARGGWGNMKLPAQVFITVFNSSPSGIPKVAGYGVKTGAYSGPLMQWVGKLDIPVGVTLQDIYQVIRNTKPTGVIAWVRVIGPAKYLLTESGQILTTESGQGDQGIII